MIAMMLGVTALFAAASGGALAALLWAVESATAAEIVDELDRLDG